MVAMDIETYDPGLKDLGDGSMRKDGRVLCVGAYGEWQGEKVSRCFDFESPADRDLCREILESEEPKVFHNGVYDLSWLCCGCGFEARGVLHDTMTRAALIDEYQDLDLDSCCRRMGLPGKNKADTIDVWYAEWQARMKEASRQYKKKGACPPELTDREALLVASGEWKKDVWKNTLAVWDDPEGKRLMMKYCLQDCAATYGLFQAQERQFEPYRKAYETECGLYPLLVKMKKAGVRLDVKRLDELTEAVDKDSQEAAEKLSSVYGITEEMLASPKKLGERLNSMGIHSPVKSPKTGAESFSADALSRIRHPVVEAIGEYKNYSALRDKYLHGSLRKSLVGDRIYCTFSPNKREEGGTVTGRLACSRPNLQNIPARDKAYGHRYAQDMRSLFLPEEGCMMAAMDYSQIEYLLLAHYAVGPQAEWLREQANAGVDFHKVAMAATGIPNRTVVKTFNYGVIYGMGWKTAMEKNYLLFEKLAAEHGTTIEQFTKQTYDDYHKRLPVIRDTMQWCQNMAKQQGYVTTMGGRREHKPKATYDPRTGQINDYIYKMLNKLIQGTAADILKGALVAADREGLFGVLTMHITVHDENVVSVPFSKEGTEAGMELQRLMDNSYRDQLLVPMKACAEVGPNWGYWSGDIWEEMKRGNFDPRLFEKDYKETH